MTARVRITDVSPRDGLQNEPGVIATADKARLIAMLATTGVDEIEATSFVSARWVPQLGDAASLLEIVASEGVDSRRPMFAALVPNDKGMLALLESNASAAHAAGWEAKGAGALIRKVSVFTAASESFARKNTNATIAETLVRFRPVISLARENALRVRGYISCAVACPFEGPIAPARVADVAQSLVELGVDELDVADTIGAADESSIARVIDAVLERVGSHWLHPERFTIHLHDTFGRAASCARAAAKLGVRSFDASVAGLGGCPYASTPGRRAPGNIDTLLLVRTLADAGLVPGLVRDVSIEALAHAAEYARATVAAARAGGGGASP
jgi:hydroxymethylglutaryl-CoA lyase